MLTSYRTPGDYGVWLSWYNPTGKVGGEFDAYHQQYYMITVTSYLCATNHYIFVTNFYYKRGSGIFVLNFCSVTSISMCWVQVSSFKHRPFSDHTDCHCWWPSEALAVRIWWVAPSTRGNKLHKSTKFWAYVIYFNPKNKSPCSQISPPLPFFPTFELQNSNKT